MVLIQRRFHAIQIDLFITIIALKASVLRVLLKSITAKHPIQRILFICGWMVSGTYCLWVIQMPFVLIRPNDNN